MILNESLIEQLKQKSGLSFEKSKDYEALCSDIDRVTSRTIGLTTIKRLLGYISDNRQTNDYTLNTIAIYLGYSSWEELCSAQRIDSEWNFEDDSVYVHKLDIGAKVIVHYLDRIVGFEVVKYDGEHYLKVLSATNSSLRKDDLLLIHRIRKGEILEAEKVIRDGKTGNYKTHGEVRRIIIS